MIGNAMFAGFTTALFVALAGAPHWAVVLGFCLSFDAGYFGRSR